VKNNIQTQPDGFTFFSGILDCDKAYRKAGNDIAADVQGGKFFAGQNWGKGHGHLKSALPFLKIENIP
jgi:hypothetical protein